MKARTKIEALLETLSSIQEPPSDERSEMMQTLEQLVIPRLAVAHNFLHAVPDCADARSLPTREELDALVHLSLADDLAGSLAFVEQVVRDGLSLESVFLHLIAEAGRELGRRWVDDESSFAEVTLGMGLLQRLVHTFGPSFSPPLLDRGLVLLTSAPGETHTLGLSIAAEFFRKAGWGVQVELDVPTADLVAVVRRERVDAVGFTITTPAHIPALKRVIRAVRKASMNRDMMIMLGGGADVSSFAKGLGATIFENPSDAVQGLQNRVMKQTSAGRSKRGPSAS